MKKLMKLLIIMLFPSILCLQNLTAIQINSGAFNLFSDRFGSLKIELQSFKNLSVENNTGFFSTNNYRTTFFSLFSDNKQVKLEQMELSQEVGQDYFYQEWENNNFLIKQSVVFFKSNPSIEYNDTFRLSTYVENKTDYLKKIRFEYLFDTWISEKKTIKFMLPDQSITGDILLTKDILPDYWLDYSSNYANGAITGILLQEKPDIMIFSNWSRLKYLHSNENYRIRSIDKFNYFPYSVEDTGVLYRYNEKEVFPGESLVYRQDFGLFNSQGYYINSNVPLPNILNVVNDYSFNLDWITSLEQLKNYVDQYNPNYYPSKYRKYNLTFIIQKTLELIDMYQSDPQTIDEYVFNSFTAVKDIIINLSEK